MSRVMVTWKTVGDETHQEICELYDENNPQSDHPAIQEIVKAGCVVFVKGPMIFGIQADKIIHIDKEV